MARDDKVQVVADIKARFDAADAVFITEFSGLTVAEQQALRRGLRSGDTEYKVLKMSLARRAIADLDTSDALDELLAGPTALAFTTGDPVTAAKALKDFADEHEALQIKGMLFSGEVLTPEKVSELAALDTREVMLAKIAGIIAAPMTNMAGLMAAFTRNAASMFMQLRDRLEAQGDPNAAAETPVADTAVADTEAESPESEKAEDESSAEEATQKQQEVADMASDDTDQPDDAGEEE